jgi:chorismate dehydratase
MQKLITNDGSETLHNKEYDEHYHSKSGAVEEAVEKYVKPCRISDLTKEGKARVIDIGFGLGYNAVAAIDANLGEIEIISFEKDENIIKEAAKLNPPLVNFHILRKLEYDPKTKSYSYEDKNIYLKIKIGDAVQRIKELAGKFDAVFLDPFSPKKNPELWTAEFFKEIAMRMKPHAILATYSCARIVRDNLKEAGFHVYDGPVIGRRGASTLAKVSRQA